ncbi:hypothetical protein EXIGLDRAFT_374820 [Exidia glandulosa HHB12029]|uniref:Uncharacterized protein n=1 Tax=Exidia glandulosa HHB12029 TaxID=1314781 RepID=A0A165PZ27_EXIGL|nr:hypothetical protein EXIGLDRAFT_374820 [Exidia glandulosa HHB12029]
MHWTPVRAVSSSSRPSSLPPAAQIAEAPSYLLSPQERNIQALLREIIALRDLQGQCKTCRRCSGHLRPFHSRRHNKSRIPIDDDRRLETALRHVPLAGLAAGQGAAYVVRARDGHQPKSLRGRALARLWHDVLGRGTSVSRRVERLDDDIRYDRAQRGWAPAHLVRCRARYPRCFSRVGTHGVETYGEDAHDKGTRGAGGRDSYD